MRYCSGSGFELLSDSDVMAVCQDSKYSKLIIQPVRKNYVGLHFACESARAQYAFLKLCCHTIATAEANGVLKDHIDFHKRNSRPTSTTPAPEFTTAITMAFCLTF